MLVFHQGAIAMLNQMGLTDRAPFPMDPTAPFGIPRLWSLAFWGGAWGLAAGAGLNLFGRSHVGERSAFA